MFSGRIIYGNKRLFVAGSFNNWNDKDIPLVKTSNGWVAAIYLAKGTHTYRFVADGRWSEDPENNNRFPNEFGQYNSVLQIGKQQMFTLEGFAKAEKVTLLGSFNNWHDGELVMTKVNNRWELPYCIRPRQLSICF